MRYWKKLRELPGLCRPCSLSSDVRGREWLDGTGWKMNNLHLSKSRWLMKLFLTWSIYCGACGAKRNRGRSAGRRWWSCSPSGCCRTSCWALLFRCWSSPPAPTCRCRRTRRYPCTACHNATPVACNQIIISVGLSLNLISKNDDCEADANAWQGHVLGSLE